MNASKKRNKQRGLSLIELMIAMVVLGIGLLGSAALVLVSINSNFRSRNDSASTAAAEAVLSEVASIPIGSTTGSVTDCAGNTSSINTTGSTSGTGATLTSGGLIDFTQAYTNVPSGYAMKYTTCDATNGTKAVYDLRWNIATTASSKEELVVVGARYINTNTSVKNAQVYASAVNLRTVVGNQGE